MAKKCQCSTPQPKEWLKGNVIGSGSFGTVHLALDSVTGALFVAKTAKNEAGIRSLKNEADILENLDSPHIVKCIGKELSSEKCERQCTIFFEYMAGGSLSDMARKFGGSLNEKIIRLYTGEILKGLSYLHKKGIVHSDIKCKNVLLGSSGDVKLADFGCAKRIDDMNTKNNMLLESQTLIGGTPLWMAPEVLRNERLDFGADIWALGCTVIEMATGRPPWSGNEKNPMAAMLRIAGGTELPQFPGHFSADGLDFLAKCLERDHRKRWTCEKLLDHPFVTAKKDLDGCSRNDHNAFSPTSVLSDVASYDSCDNSGDDEFLAKIPFFSTRLCCQEKDLIPRNAPEDHLELSDNWITVRIG